MHRLEVLPLHELRKDCQDRISKPAKSHSELETEVFWKEHRISTTSEDRAELLSRLLAVVWGPIFLFVQLAV